MNEMKRGEFLSCLIIISYQLFSVWSMPLLSLSWNSLGSFSNVLWRGDAFVMENCEGGVSVSCWKTSKYYKCFRVCNKGNKPSHNSVSFSYLDNEPNHQSRKNDYTTFSLIDLSSFPSLLFFQRGTNKLHISDYLLRTLTSYYAAVYLCKYTGFFHSERVEAIASSHHTHVAIKSSHHFSQKNTSFSSWTWIWEDMLHLNIRFLSPKFFFFANYLIFAFEGNCMITCTPQTFFFLQCRYYFMRKNKYLLFSLLAWMYNVTVTKIRKKSELVSLLVRLLLPIITIENVFIFITLFLQLYWLCISRCHVFHRLSDSEQTKYLHKIGKHVT